MKKYFIIKTALFVLCLSLAMFFISCNETAENNTPTAPVDHIEHDADLGKPPEWYWYTDEPYAIIKINKITDEIISELWHRNHPTRLDSTKIDCSVLYSNGSFRLLPQSGDGSVAIDTVVPPFDSITEIYFPIQSVSKLKDNDIILIKVLWTPMYDVENNDSILYYASELDDEGNAEFFVFNENKIIINEESKKMKSYYPINLFNSNINQIQIILGNEGTIKPLEDGMTVEEVKEFFNMVNIVKTKN